MAHDQAAWAVYNDRYGVSFCTISDSRSCAISEHCILQRKTWAECRMDGDVVVQIKIEVMGR
jgi:hypothetical protein